MIRADIYVKNIDYKTLINLMMPYIEKGLSDKDNPVSDFVAKIISKNGRPTKFSSLLLSIIPRKDDIVASLLPHFDEVLIGFLNSQLVKNQIAARVISVKSGSATKEEESILKFRLEIDTIDYVTTVDHLLPRIIRKLSEKEDNGGRIGKLLFGMKELPVKMMKAAIGAVPVNQRDEIAVAFLSEYRKELKALLNDMMIKNNIKAEIVKVKIDSIPESLFLSGYRHE